MFGADKNRRGDIKHSCSISIPVALAFRTSWGCFASLVHTVGVGFGGAFWFSFSTQCSDKKCKLSSALQWTALASAPRHFYPIQLELRTLIRCFEAEGIDRR